MPTLVDLGLIDRPGVLSAFLLDGPEPAVVDCGPGVCAARLEAGLAALGSGLADVRHILLTHIHPDHAGGAGLLVRRHPHLQVHVHEVGAPHLLDPERLERSARRLYGEDFDRLFGPIDPVPAANVHVLAARVLDLDVLETPGHAWHHVSFLAANGDCYAGDAVACRLRPGGFAYPASAAPEIDVEAWLATYERLAAARPRRLLLPHFGIHEDASALIALARQRFADWAALVEHGASEEEFVAHVESLLAREGDDEEQLVYHALAFPTFGMSYQGIKRYFDKRREAELAARP